MMKNFMVFGKRSSLLFLFSFTTLFSSVVLASLEDLKNSYPLVRKTLNPPGVCTNYNPSYCSPFTTTPITMKRPFEKYIHYATFDKTSLSILVDSAEKEVVPEYYVKGMAGEDGFYHKEHYDPKAPGWCGTCHKWCAWQTSPFALKTASKKKGYICGRYHLSQGDIAEFFTAVYPSVSTDKDKFQHFYGDRTNAFYKPENYDDKAEVARASAINKALMQIIDASGYQNSWPHEMDKAYYKYIVEEERDVTTNVDAHSPSVWNQPTFHFERYSVTDLTLMPLPLLSFFNEEWEPYGPTKFYTGTPYAIQKLKYIEDIEYTLRLIFAVLKDTEGLRGDLKNKVYPLLKDDPDFENVPEMLRDYIYKIEKKSSRYYMDVVKALHQEKLNAFNKAKKYLALKDRYSGIYVRSKIKYLQECKFRAATNFVREANYDYYILQDGKEDDTYSMWARSKLIDKARPDFIAATQCVDDDCKALVEDPEKLKKVSDASVEDKIDSSDFVYKFATGTFLKLLERCEPVEVIEEKINLFERNVAYFQKQLLSQYHTAQLSRTTKEKVRQEYQQLKDGPEIENKYVQLKNSFDVLPSRHVGGYVIDKEQIIFLDWDQNSGKCLGENGNYYATKYCVSHPQSKMVYKSSKKECREYVPQGNSYVYLRTVPRETCNVISNEPVDPTITPSPVIPEPVSPQVLTERGLILEELTKWQQASFHYASLNKDQMKKEAKDTIMRLAYYDVSNNMVKRSIQITPSGMMKTKVRAIWNHLEKNIYHYAVKKYQLEARLRSMIRTNYPAKHVEKFGKPVIKDLVTINMRLQLLTKYAIDPSTITFPNSAAGKEWYKLNGEYYRKKFSRSKYLYYRSHGYF